MRIKLIKQALAAAITAADITTGAGKVEAYSWSPAQPGVPAFTCGQVTVDPFTAFAPSGGRTTKTVEITCSLLTSIADDRDGQELLDDLISDEGPLSIVAVLASTSVRGAPGQPALGGLADDVTLIRVDGYRMLTYAGEDGNFYGADLTIRVVGS